MSKKSRQNPKWHTESWWPLNDDVRMSNDGNWITRYGINGITIGNPGHDLSQVAHFFRWVLMIYPDQEGNKLLGNKVMEASKRGEATCAAYGYGAWKYLVNPSTLKLHETSRSLLNSPKHLEPIQLELPPKKRVKICGTHPQMQVMKPKNWRVIRSPLRNFRHPGGFPATWSRGNWPTVGGGESCHRKLVGWSILCPCLNHTYFLMKIAICCAYHNRDCWIMLDWNWQSHCGQEYLRVLYVG